ncbi:MAG: maleylpyruvate isomerase family mycothiol-dependent enzyme [Actinomycetia bacterium]|nr:maleylpyruvate isomerase family mycothiol-dependent enzyme [Actinomycetes bacterium]
MAADSPSLDLYPDTRDELIELARSLTPEQAETIIPLTPDWRVKDAVAHVCGIIADILAGRLEGLGSDEWTAAQVADRADATIDQICDEWLSYALEFGERLAAEPFLGVRLTGDLIVHIQDIQDALGIEQDVGSVATTVGAHRYVPQLQERVHEQLGIGLDVELTDGTSWPAPGAYQRVSLRATPHDFLRSVTGRRTRAEVEALDWTGDPTEILDGAFTSYGKLD